MKIPFSDGIVRKVTWNRTVYYVYDRLLSGYGIDGLWLRGMVSRNQGTQQLQWLFKLSVFSLPAPQYHIGGKYAVPVMKPDIPSVFFRGMAHGLQEAFTFSPYKNPSFPRTIPHSIKSAALPVTNGVAKGIFWELS